MSPKRYIPILITLALLALIGLQGIWLFMVYKHKARELGDKAKEAVLETTKRLQKEEDSKYIIKNIDSLLVTEDVIGTGNGADLKVIVSNIKNKYKIDTLKIDEATELQHKIKINGDTSTETTIVNIGNGKKQKIVIHSKSLEIGTEENGKIKQEMQREEEFTQYEGSVKKKAEGLQTLFLKMALNSKDHPKDLRKMVDFEHVKSILNTELENRGVDIIPEEIMLTGSPIETRGITRQEAESLHSAMEESGNNWKLDHMVRLPLFPDDIFNQNVFIEITFGSTTNYLMKQMAGLVSLSLFITILIGVIMIYLFRRMLSQEKLHTMKNDFINNMTHELKTPIATISLAVDAINNPAVKNDEEKLKNYSGILKEENKKLNDHVERVLQMAMLDKGETVLVKRPMNLKTILENCIKAYQLQIQDKNAKVNLNIQDNIIIQGDEFHLTNTFTNLLDNALKYSGTEPIITISAARNGKMIEVRFADNGIGIDKKEQEKIFDKFYRVQGGNLHDVKGFGLGLSYVKSIIEAHDGTIELQSETGKGSEFIIKLREHEV